MSDSEKLQESTTISEDDFLHRVSKLRNEMDGKTIVSFGGVWTAEAREPDRKQKLHQQLVLARQLRALLEAAAENAEQARTQQERLDILQENAVHMNTLVSLTEAVRGGYELMDYDEYTRFYKDFDARMNDTLNKNHATIVNQLVAMAEERRTVENGNVDHVRSPMDMAGTKRSLTEGNSTLNIDSSTHEDESDRKPSASTSYTTILSSDDDDSENFTQTPKKLKRQKKPMRQMRHPNPPSRKCHDCKSTTSLFRRCHYWLLTGSKCNKIYCSGCLLVKYGLANQNKDHWVTNNPDWHCPSCLGTCLCMDCIKGRKRGGKNKKESIYTTRAKNT